MITSKKNAVSDALNWTVFDFCSILTEKWKREYAWNINFPSLYRQKSHGKRDLINWNMIHSFLCVSFAFTVQKSHSHPSIKSYLLIYWENKIQVTCV